MHALVQIKSEVVLQPVCGIPQLGGAVHHLCGQQAETAQPDGMLGPGFIDMSGTSVILETNGWHS